MPSRAAPKVAQSGYSRVFVLPGQASPFTAPQYQGLWKPSGVNWALGPITPIRLPSPSRYNEFVTAGTIIGDRGLPEITITARYQFDVSTILELAKRQCANDLQIHFGQCQNPQDFNGGWDKILVVEGAVPTNYSTNELGAMAPGERAMIDETVPFSGETIYEITKQVWAQKASAEIVQEIVGIIVCDAVTCESCGIPSDGCQVVFAVTLSAGGSPGLAAELISTDDGGDTWNQELVSTLTPAIDPTDVFCSGTNVVVLAASGAHYKDAAAILAGTGSWALATSGFVLPTGAPNAGLSLGPSQNWIVGDGGYIYFSSDLTAGVEVQDAGSATSQNLNDIAGVDLLNLVAVGASNAVVYTRNGGNTWASVTGPAVGVALNTVAMVTDLVWIVGTADGKLWMTRDGGTSWTERTFTGSGSGTVESVRFANRTVGYMAHDTGTVGRILRTIDGGHSWYLSPEDGSMIAHLKTNQIATCDNPNIAFAGGGATGGVDGIILKGA